jgi:hypothetical protein
MGSSELFLLDISNRSLPILDHEGLLEALWVTDSVTLLMVLTHLTGDEVFLQRFVPHLVSPLQGNIRVPSDLGRELRDRLFTRLTTLNAAPEPPMSCALFMRMTSAAVGKPIAEDFSDSLREGLKYIKKLSFDKKAKRCLSFQNYNISIINAGVSGLLANISRFTDCEGAATATAGRMSCIDIQGSTLAKNADSRAPMSGSEIHKKIEDMAAYQRLRHWAFDSRNNVRLDGSVKWALHHIPYFAEWFGLRSYWIASEGFYQGAIDRSPNQNSLISANNWA